MSRFSDIDPQILHQLQDSVRHAVSTEGCFEDAAQTLTAQLRRSFTDSAPLVRVFLTTPLEQLPGELQSLARASAPEVTLKGSTQVLTLMGTSGARPEWNNSRTSAGHRAIPLASQRFVDELPMVASLLSELEVPIDAPPAKAFASRVLAGGWYGVFFVKDASASLDRQGRQIIPSRGFVREYGLKSVWGIAVSFLSGQIAMLLAFTCEELERQHVERLVPLMRSFKVASTELVKTHRIFRPEETCGAHVP